jgi:trans-aconitate methyltransferase
MSPTPCSHTPPLAALRQRAWYPLRHLWALHFGARRSQTFTRFARLPNQCDALAGPVYDFLRPAGQQAPLQIVVVGCSSGAEPYTIASVLAQRRPQAEFHITAVDIDAAVLAQAERACYSPADASGADADFLAATFEAEGADLRVRAALRACVTFQRGDVLDAQAIAALPRADLVVAQNFLYHLRRRDARRAFTHLCSLMQPHAALFVDGMDIDLRTTLSARAGLRPLDFRIEAIHRDALARRGSRWPWTYWGLEPFDGARRDWRRRYATVFLREAAAQTAGAE